MRTPSIFNSLLFGFLSITLIYFGGLSCGPGTSGANPEVSSQALACLNDGDCPSPCTCPAAGTASLSGTCENNSEENFCGGTCTRQSGCPEGQECLPSEKIVTEDSNGFPQTTVIFNCRSPDACPALNLAGNWRQSFVCFDSVTGTCERDDNDAFEIQQNCTIINSDVLDVFSGTLSENVVTWSGSEDLNDNFTDEPGDYNESGTWTCSNENNCISSSTFTYKNAPGQTPGGGPCRANLRKGSAPDPLTDCPEECSGQVDCP